MERQTVGSSSNRSIGRAPAARSWYTTSAAIGRPWFQHSTITFSFGFTRNVFLITFFARDSYSDMLPPAAGEAPRRLNRMGLVQPFGQSDMTGREFAGPWRSP